MSEDDLDKLFKEAAEGFKAPDDPSAWRKMSAKLDNFNAPSGFWNWKTISGAALVGFTGIALLWFATLENSSEVDKNELSIDRKSNPPQVSKLSQESNQGTTTSDIKNLIDNSPQVLQHQPSIISDISNPINTVEKTGSNNDGKSEDHLNLIVVSNNKISAEKVDSDIKQNHEIESQSGTPISTNNPGVFSKPKNLISQIDSLSAEKEKGLHGDSSISTLAVEDSKMEKQKVTPHISIKLSVSPDFSSIKYFSPDKPGFNYGLLIGYSFNDRWSVFSGAISSRKIYSSRSIDAPYTTSGGYDYKVNELDGDCRVIDIPINFYYTMFPDRAFSIRAGIGISSYLMLQEDYTYYIDNPYGSDVYYQRVSRENNEWFKMLNVSVTLQKKLSDHFYLELEPFLKAPLAGVGEGEVSLVSMGAFLNLRFDIPIHKP